MLNPDREGDELSQCLTKVPFAKRDDSLEAFLLHRPDKPFRIRVAVRRTRRRSNDTNARRREPLLHRFRLPTLFGETPSSQCSL